MRYSAKKFTALLLLLAMTFQTLPLAAFAAERERNTANRISHVATEQVFMRNMSSGSLVC